MKVAPRLCQAQFKAFMQNASRPSIPLLHPLCSEKLATHSTQLSAYLVRSKLLPKLEGCWIGALTDRGGDAVPCRQWFGRTPHCHNITIFNHGKWKTLQNYPAEDAPNIEPILLFAPTSKLSMNPTSPSSPLRALNMLST